MTDPIDPAEDGAEADDELRFSGTAGSEGSDASDRNGPLSDLASSIERGPDSVPDGFDRLFEREAVAEIDSDQLWERLESDRPAAEDLLGADREIREVAKASYCHRCEHFAEPPDVGCTRDGTEILEMPTLETFRVADCPVVLEDEELERRY
ncbi:hypothetical protein [Halosolutus gelatinilyticus]|uniref:hypothetical protein n=1 Tax=Halosolutus gelatinilyticus TaxID=2931975 RepID=UPI001FF20E1F|nr:hypothetical protein [Halosolutus gelatinilyticus]